MLSYTANAQVGGKLAQIGSRLIDGAARKMAEAYNVVYATRAGAQRSNHYDGFAVDCSAVNLPRTLTLRAPDGSERTFDLISEKAETNSDWHHAMVYRDGAWLVVGWCHMRKEIRSFRVDRIHEAVMAPKPLK